MEITIVPASVDMAPSLVELSHTLGYDTTEESLRARVKAIASRDDHRLLVATEGRTVVGFCHGYIRVLVEVDNVIEIGGLAVADGYQGRGIGKQLVQGIEAWAKEQGIKTIVLSSNIKRTQAHAFYEHLGYTKIKQQFALQKDIS